MSEWKEIAICLGKKINTLKQSYAKEKTHRERLNATIFSMQNQLMEQRKQVEAHKETIGALDQRHRDIQSGYRKLQFMHQQQTKRAETARNQKQVLEQEVTALRKEREALTTMKQQLQQQLRHCKLRLQLEMYKSKNISSIDEDEDLKDGESDRDILGDKSQNEEQQLCQQTVFLMEEDQKSGSIPTNPIKKNHEKNTEEIVSVVSNEMSKISESNPNSKRVKLPTRTQIHENSTTRYVPGLSLECEECNEIFLRHYDFIEHRDKIHDDKRPYRCHKCKRRYKDLGNLTYHIKQAHEGVRRYKCEHCDKEFYYQSQWRDHCSTHTDERPFVCSQCDLSFKRKGNLSKHIRQVHLKEKNYRCGICLKEFFMKKQAVQHLRVHNEEKLSRFHCEVCDSKFKTRADLKEHKQTHNIHCGQDMNQEMPYKCSKCRKGFAEQSHVSRHEHRCREQ